MKNITNIIAYLIIAGFFVLLIWGSGWIKGHRIKESIKEYGYYQYGDWRIIGKVQEKGFVDAED